jgi:hypothetical protein
MAQAEFALRTLAFMNSVPEGHAVNSPRIGCLRLIVGLGLSRCPLLLVLGSLGKRVRTLLLPEFERVQRDDERGDGHEASDNAGEGGPPLDGPADIAESPALARLEPLAFGDHSCGAS